MINNWLLGMKFKMFTSSLVALYCRPRVGTIPKLADWIPWGIWLKIEIIDISAVSNTIVVPHLSVYNKNKKQSTTCCKISSKISKYRLFCPFITITTIITTINPWSFCDVCISKRNF